MKLILTFFGVGFLILSIGGCSFLVKCGEAASLNRTNTININLNLPLKGAK